MRAGILRSVVSIETPTLAQSATGASRITGWSAIANGSAVRAEVVDGSAREQIQAGQLNPQRLARVTIRYLAGVTAECRVVFGSRILQVVGVQNVDQKNRTLILTCVEKAP